MLSSGLESLYMHQMPPLGKIVSMSRPRREWLVLIRHGIPMGFRVYTKSEIADFAPSIVSISDTAFDQLFEIFILHGGGDTFFVIHLFVNVILRFVRSLRHENVQFMLTVEDASDFDPNAETDESGEGAMRHGGSEIDPYVQRWITAENGEVGINGMIEESKDEG